MLSKSHTKYIQSLQHKKSRDEAGLFIAEGPKLVAELLQSNRFNCKEIIALPAWLEENKLYSKGSGAELYEVLPFELEKIAALSTPNQVLAVFEMMPPVEDFSAVNQLVLMLDTIQDPGNMGTIIRIADWFGIAHIVCSFDSADLYNPKVVQSTMGSIARVNVVHTGLNEWLQNHKEIPVYATALNGTNLKEMKPVGEGIILIGNESKGIRPDLMKMAKEKITIPKFGAAESLNAAVAAGIILSHLK